MTVEAELAIIIVQLQLQSPVLKFVREGVAKLLERAAPSSPAAAERSKP